MNSMTSHSSWKCANYMAKGPPLERQLIPHYFNETDEIIDL